MAANAALQTVEGALRPVPNHGWRNGLANLLRNELRAWWGTKTWLIHALIWTVVLNGFTALVLWTGPRAASADAARTVFSLFTGIFGALGVIVAVVGVTVLRGHPAAGAALIVAGLALIAATMLVNARTRS